MASFAGTNAIFRRQALDSVCGIQYGSLTEDAFTGKMMVERGWKGFYFRKDFEGEEEERIRLAEGAIPESVAASLGTFLNICLNICEYVYLFMNEYC